MGLNGITEHTKHYGFKKFPKKLIGKKKKNQSAAGKFLQFFKNKIGPKKQKFET